MAINSPEAKRNALGKLSSFLNSVHREEGQELRLLLNNDIFQYMCGGELVVLNSTMVMMLKNLMIKAGENDIIFR